MTRASGRSQAGSHWLRLREPADAAARSLELVDEIRRYVSTDRVVVHDLGSGAGSMGRWLAGQLSGPQHWVLYDRDAELLGEAEQNPPAGGSDGSPVTLAVRWRDVTRLEPGELKGATLVTASALLDVMTADELDRLVATCAAVGCPVLITLTVTGLVDLAPSDPFDDLVTEAFNAHQQRVTDAGKLLGPCAASAAVDAFTRHGLEVMARPSPWRLGPNDPALIVEWFTGWLGAATEQRPGLRAEARAYAKRRFAEVAAGRLAVTVHHQDFLVRRGMSPWHG
jgi:hypothetical protein